MYITEDYYAELANYRMLKENVTSIEGMFGNGAGYQGELLSRSEAAEVTEELDELIKDAEVTLNHDDEYTQAFNPRSLGKLAKAYLWTCFRKEKNAKCISYF